MRLTIRCAYPGDNTIYSLKGDFYMTKTIDERIAETKERIAQYENQVKRLLQKRKEDECKARTHRLIERGAILESMIDGAEALTNEQIKAVLTAALNSDVAIHALTFAQERHGASPSGETKNTQGAGA